MSNLTSLEGKICVITGGGGGMGTAMAKMFLEAGAEGITLVDEREDALATAVASLPAEHVARVLTITGDVTQETTHANYIKTTVEKWGRIDISVQTAGTCPPPRSILDTSVADWDTTFAVNGRGVFLGLRESMRAMLASPSGGKDCAIVLIASQFGLEGLPGFGAYSASKFAVRGLMQVASQEVAAQGIRINAICPGPIDTRMIRINTDDQIKAIVGGVPLGRLGQAEEIASAALFLCSKAGGYCSGTAMKVDGGMARFA